MQQRKPQSAHQHVKLQSFPPQEQQHTACDPVYSYSKLVLKSILVVWSTNFVVLQVNS